MVESIPGQARFVTSTETDTQARTRDDGSDVGVVTDLLHQVNHRIRRTAAGEFEPLGVTAAQMRALRTLARCDRPMRMSELAESLGIVRPIGDVGRRRARTTPSSWLVRPMPRIAEGSASR